MEGVLRDFREKKTWQLWEILVSDWLKLNKYSPLKLGDTMNCY
jgi:hypothetical protein